MVIARIIGVKVKDFSGYVLEFQAVPGKKEGAIIPKLVAIVDEEGDFKDSRDVPKAILHRGYRLAAVAFNKLKIKEEK